MGRNMQRIGKLGLVLAMAVSAFAVTPEPARAQPAGFDAGKHCHTFRTCNFGKRGNYRGCLSTYACKVCRFVPANCTVDGQRKVCQRLKCGFGPVS